MPKKKGKKYVVGGNISGPSHKKGGVVIEAEGGEYIIKKNSVNRSTVDMLEYINEHGDLPWSDARNRGRISNIKCNGS